MESSEAMTDNKKISKIYILPQTYKYWPLLRFLQKQLLIYDAKFKILFIK